MTTQAHDDFSIEQTEPTEPAGGGLGTVGEEFGDAVERLLSEAGYTDGLPDVTEGRESVGDIHDGLQTTGGVTNGSDHPQLNLVYSSDSIRNGRRDNRDRDDQSTSGTDDPIGDSGPDSDTQHQRLQVHGSGLGDGEPDSGSRQADQQLDRESSPDVNLRQVQLVPSEGLVEEPSGVQWKEYTSEDLEIVKVSAKSVVRYYPLIAKDLRSVIKKSRVSIQSSQILDVLEEGRGWLFVGFDPKTKKYQGFVIVSQEEPDQFTGNRPFLIWFAYCEKPGLAKVLFDELEELATDFGYDEMVMRSVRPGWERLSQAYGFTLKERVFSKKLGRTWVKS